jgi:thiamine transport system permease protein
MARAGTVRPTPRRRWPTAVLAAIPLLFIGLFFVYPLVTILVTSLSRDGSLDLGVFGDVAANPTFQSVAWFTLWQAVVSTILTLMVGLPAAYVIARFDFPGKAWVRAGVTIPFVLPTVVVATAFLALLGPSGPLGVDLRGTIWAILLAHVFFNVAVVIRTVGSMWERLDPRLEEAATTLGAGRMRAFREVTLPLLAPAIASAASIVFLFTFTSFGVILILGDLRHATLEVEIWRQTTAFLDLPTAAVLSILQLMAVSAMLLVYSRYQQRRAIELNLRPTSETAHRPRNRREWGIVAATLSGLGLLLATPLVVLVARSLRNEGRFTFAAYRGLGDETGSALFVPPIEAVLNSLEFALAATFIALLIGMMAATVIAYRSGPATRAFDALLMLPLGTSAVTIGFGFLVALDAPIDLRTSIWLVPIAHALIAIPFVVRTTVPVMRSVRHRLREAAAMLGASPSEAFREVDLPIVARAALVGAGFAFAVSLGEFGATSFIARPDSPTLPIAIFRLLGQPGSVTFARAMALATILMLLTAAVVAAIDRLRIGDLGDF